MIEVQNYLEDKCKELELQEQFLGPQILILDESTNALDATNESKTLEFLLNKFSDRIIIICTHKKKF